MIKTISFSDWKPWTVIAIVIKLIILSFFIFNSNAIHSSEMIYGIALKANDYSYFLRPVDNYFTHGNYTLEPLGSGYFAGRMPGLSLPYMFFRYWMSQNNALLTLALFQFILSSISAYFLAKTAYLISEKANVFYLTFFVFAISTFTSVFDFMVGCAESLSVSASIFFLYHFISYTKKEQKYNLILSGFFLTWAIFLRPFLGLLIILIPLYLLFSLYRKKSLWQLLSICVLFTLPFTICESAWVINNYSKLNKVILLEDEDVYGTTYSKGWLAIREYINNSGGEGAYFENGSEAWWFREQLDSTTVANYTIPARMISNVSFTTDSLKSLRNIFVTSRTLINKPEYAHQLDSLDNLTFTIAKRYNQEYVQKNQYYWLTKYFYSIKRLVFKSGSSYLTLPPYSKMNYTQKAIKIFYSFLYYLVLITGLMALFSLKYQDNSYHILFSLLISNIILTIIIISDIQEARYFLTAYPILLISSSIYFATKTSSKF